MKIVYGAMTAAACAVSSPSAEAACVKTNVTFNGTSAPALQSYTGSSTGMGSSAAIANDVAIEAALDYANYCIGLSSSSSITINIPQGSFFFSPYTVNGTIASSTVATVTINSINITVQPQSTYTQKYTGATLQVVNGVIDISFYNSNGTAFTSNLTSSSAGHITISGQGSCVNKTIGIIGSAGCPNGTEIYTDDGLTAVYGDESNHVTFSNLEFNRVSLEASQGIVTSTAAASGTQGNYDYYPASATVSISAGFPGADWLFQNAVEEISYNPDTAAADRYLRKYSSPGTSASGIPTLVAGPGNDQLLWGEPSEMQTSNTCTIAGVTGIVSTGDTSFVCQVAPTCNPVDSVNGMSTTCTIWMNSDKLPALNSYVCIKAKWPNSYAYYLHGPGFDGYKAGTYGGTDVTFSNVTWLKQTGASIDEGFTNFAITTVGTSSGGYAIRSQIPVGASEVPCLSSSDGGPQISDGGFTYSAAWPAGTDTISGFVATATGDDSVAIYGQASGSAFILSNDLMSDSFARGLYLNNAGTLDNPYENGTSIFTTQSSSSMTTLTSTSGSNTLIRNAYCLEGYTLTTLTCVGLDPYSGNY